MCLNVASVAFCLEMGSDVAQDAGWIVGRIERTGTFVLRVRSFPVPHEASSAHHLLWSTIGASLGFQTACFWPPIHRHTL